jgi:hypothetical protein
MEDDEIESYISKKTKRYPFNGRSNYLIDKFYIIGYNIPTLLKLLIECNENTLLNNININKKKDNEDKKSSINLQSFNLKEEPILLNEFASDYNKECLDFSMVLDMIFPNKINLYYSEEELSTYMKDNKKRNTFEDDDFVEYEEYDFFDNELLEPKAVVFSSNPQIENNSKKSINGFGYIFYKKLKRKKFLSKKVLTFYIPITFSIISEFPFYNSFYKLCQQIRNLYSYPEKDIPIEIILYNIIKNTQSPLNGDIFLTIKPFSLLNDNNDNNNNKAVNNNNIMNNKKIGIIPEEMNEEDDQQNNIKKENEKLDDGDDGGWEIIRKKTSKDFQLKYTLKPINAERPINRKFHKKHSVILTIDKPLIKNEEDDDKKPKYDSPIAKRNNSGIIGINENRKTKRHLTEKNTKSHLILKLKKLKNKNYSANFKTEDLFPKIKFEFLTGYPLIQYNLAKVLLKTLSPSDVIEVFFYTFLEKDVIFFSKNMQYLSLTINSYLNLNYPLNEEKYYFTNASVSFNNYVNNNSVFVGSTFTTIIGINDQYNPKYTSCSQKLKDHLAVDLDKGEIYKIDDKNDKVGSKKNKELFSLIKKICGKKEQKSDKKQTILSKEIFVLNQVLTKINNKLNGNETENSEGFELFKNGDLFDYDDNTNNYIKQNNLVIQQSFYRLIIHLCQYFYQNLSIKTEDDDQKKNNLEKTQMNVIYEENYKNEEQDKFTKEETYFLEELRNTMKYESFVYGFVQSYSPIDLYKIPLTFMEEFLSIVSRKSTVFEEGKNFFDIIDQLYETSLFQTININFNSFFNVYYKKYKDFFDREINDFNEQNELNEDLIKLKYIYDDNKKRKFLKYRDYELDNNLLMNYVTKINNLKENEYKDMFNLSDSLNNNEPQNILVIDIENIIEKYSVETLLLSKSDLCCSIIIILFSLSLNFLDSNMDCSFLSVIFNDFIIFRKYYSYFMNMIYRLFSNCINQQNYSRAHFYLIYYYICVNSLREKRLVPNENLMNILKKFNENESLMNINNNVMNDISENKNEIIEKKNETFQNVSLTEQNLFLMYNFNQTRFIKEKEIIEEINSNKTDMDEYQRKPKIRFNNKIRIIDTECYNLSYILTTLVNIYNKFIVDLDESHIDFKCLIDFCMNILVYIRNFKEFEDKNDIKERVEIIFFLFLNKLESIK